MVPFERALVSFYRPSIVSQRWKRVGSTRGSDRVGSGQVIILGKLYNFCGVSDRNCNEKVPH